MFSKAKNKKDDAVLEEVSEVPQALLEEPVSKKAAARGNAKAKPVRSAPSVPSLISADVVIRGVIESQGEMQFDGEIEGDVRAASLTIGEGARVVGEVVAEKVRVAGTVEGAIRATRVELASGCHVKGDVTHKALAIEAGAIFEGNVRHSDDPTGEPSLRSAARAPAPTPLTEMAASPALDEPAADPMADAITTRAAEPAPRPLSQPVSRKLSKAELR